jgi:hypothetical protein
MDPPTCPIPHLLRHLNLRGLVFTLINKKFCCSFFFSVVDFRLNNFLDFSVYFTTEVGLGYLT